MFNGFYGTLDHVVYNQTSEWMFNQVKDAAGIHFSTFQDPKDKGKTPDAVDAQEEAIAAGAQTVRSNHKPGPAWKAKNFVPVDPNADRGIKILELR